MEFTVNWRSNIEHAPAPTYAFQNLWTGQVRQVPSRWLTGGSIVLNLNSPKLAQRLCRPVSLAASGSLLPGTATIEGSFVISTGMVNTGVAPVESGRIYIQRCGSKRRVQIDEQNLPLAANAHAVLWGVSATSSRMTGLLLPSLRPFTVSAPSTNVSPILTDQLLYFDKENSNVWSTVSPFPSATRRSGS